MPAAPTPDADAYLATLPPGLATDLRRHIDAPQHLTYFGPGDVWAVDSRQVSHQIFYGRRALSVDFFVDPKSMRDPVHSAEGIIQAGRVEVVVEISSAVRSYSGLVVMDFYIAPTDNGIENLRFVEISCLFRFAPQRGS